MQKLTTGMFHRGLLLILVLRRHLGWHADARRLGWKRAVSDDATGVAGALQRQVSLGQGLADQCSRAAKSRWDHYLEAPDDKPGGAALHRPRSGDRKAIGCSAIRRLSGVKRSSTSSCGHRTESHNIAQHLCLTVLCRSNIGEMVLSNCARSPMLPQP